MEPASATLESSQVQEEVPETADGGAAATDSGKKKREPREKKERQPRQPKAPKEPREPKQKMVFRRKDATPQAPVEATANSEPAVANESNT